MPDLPRPNSIRLIAPNSPFSRLPIPFPFELTVGANGRIWISATSTGGSSGETDIGRVLLIKKMLEDVDDGRLSVDGGIEGKEGFADWMRRNGDVMR
jgi:exosome complex RNA-binding protein Rrp4